MKGEDLLVNYYLRTSSGKLVQDLMTRKTAKRIIEEGTVTRDMLLHPYTVVVDDKWFFPQEMLEK